ncbi:hypothetical protein LCGC14_3098790, partial [marine sediment metagenome]
PVPPPPAPAPPMIGLRGDPLHVESNILIATVMWRRPEIFEFWAQRMKLLGCDILVVGSEGERSQQLAEKHGCIYLERPNSPLGAKFNACVNHARCDWVALWADDDWHAPQRLHVTMHAATTHGVAIASTHKRLFYVLQNGQRWLYDYGRNPVKLDYVLGGTLLFRKTVWDTAKFPELNAAVDNGFIVDALQRDRVPYTIVDDETLYVAMIHDDNTRQPWNPLFPYTEWFGNIAGVMGADFDRYRGAYETRLSRTP